MRPVLYHVALKPGVRLSDAELTLKLALLAAEGLHGSSRVRSGCAFHRDPLRHALLVRAKASIGATVASVFRSFLIHEFGKDSFTLRRRDLRAASPSLHQRAQRPHRRTLAA